MSESAPILGRPSERYGEGVALERQVAAAPLEGGAPEVPYVPRPRPPALSDPSLRPDEPVTAGVPFGPGSSGPGEPLLPVDDSVLVRAAFASDPRPELLDMLIAQGEL